MIASLEGTLQYKGLQQAVIALHGISIEVLCAPSTLEKLGEEGQAVKLYTYLHVRENALTLYGFLTKNAKDCFLQLLSIHGIGPSLGLSIMGALTPEALANAVLKKNASAFESISGVGKKMAERLLSELSSRTLSTIDPITATALSTAEEDTKTALLRLGFKVSEATKAIEKARCATTDNHQLLITALQLLGKKSF